MDKKTRYRGIVAIGLTIAIPAIAGCNQASLFDTPKSSRLADPAAPQNTAVNVNKTLAPSIVSVITRSSSKDNNPHGSIESEGSGIVYRSNGYIITNAHVVTNPDNTFVDFTDGSESKAKVIGTDTFSDIAIIKIDRDNLSVPPFGQSKNVSAGQTAIAIGNPFGFENTVTEGIVSATHRSIPGGAPSLTNLLQTDAPISPGNSGGALANADGQVIGITVAFIPPQEGAVSLGFAVPMDEARRVGDQLISTGKATHAFMGLSPQMLTSEQQSKLHVPVSDGAVVQSVTNGGPADRAGIQKDDVIVKMDNEVIKTPDDVFGVVNGHSPGDQINVSYYKGSDLKSSTVTLGERSGSGKASMH